MNRQINSFQNMYYNFGVYWFKLAMGRVGGIKIEPQELFLWTDKEISEKRNFSTLARYSET